MLTDIKQRTDKIGADIHTHILPEIDDGARDCDESIRLIEAQRNMGVTDLVFTPHFYMSEISVEDFLICRDLAFKKLSEKIGEMGLFEDMRFHLGAEVRYDPNLIRTDLKKLCIGETSYLLLEPTASFPFNFENTLDYMLSKGITPVIAHIERYDYLLKDKKFLDKLLDSGVILQCNASAVFGKYRSKTAVNLIKQGYVGIIASDCHDPQNRPPMLADAYSALKKEGQRLINNSIKLINDRLF